MRRLGSQCLFNRDSVSVWEEEEVLKVFGLVLLNSGNALEAAEPST